MRQYESALNQGFMQLKPIQTLTKTETTIDIDPTSEFQSVVGFGGAFTEAAAHTFARMSATAQEKILSLYFSPTEGLRYRLGRVAIHSCDFALGNYTYVDEGDTTLSTFSIDREKQWVIPMIQKAEEVAQHPIGLLASPWSPPAWMKTTGEMNHGGKLKPEYYGTWAAYFLKFIEAMTQEGLTIQAVTAQNEPAAVQVWDSCVYTPEEEGRFVLDHLGPLLKNSAHADVNIYIWDHNRDIIVERVKPILENPKAKQYVHGVGFHWYVSEAFEHLSEVKRLFPETHLLFTEGCIEGGPHLGAFHTGERYVRNMIGDFSHGCEGYIDWNLCLDMQGGPNHVGNYCDAPILCDPSTDTVHINSSYYGLGHFARFVDVDAVRIGTQASATAPSHVAFKNPDGTIVVVLQNESETLQTTTVRLHGHPYAISLQPHSYSTLILGD